MLSKDWCFRIRWEGRDVWVGVNVLCWFHVQYSSHVFHILQVDFCLLKYVDHRQLTTYYLTTKMAGSCPLFLNVVREKEKGCQKIGRFWWACLLRHIKYVFIHPQHIFQSNKLIKYTWNVQFLLRKLWVNLQFWMSNILIY